MSYALLKALPGTRTIFMPKGNLKEVTLALRDGDKIEVRSAHTDLATAAKILPDYGFDPRKAKAIFLGVRNPYDLMASTYFHHRRRAEKGKLADTHVDRAAIEDFETFARTFRPRNFQQWMFLDGELAPNLFLIRFEHLRKDLKTAEKQFDLAKPRIPHLNQGAFSDYRSLYTPELNQIVKKKYGFLFDMGLYRPLADNELG